MKQCSRHRARTTSQQRSTLPATGRGTIFVRAQGPGGQKCSPAGGYQDRVCRMADPLTLIRSGAFAHRPLPAGAVRYPGGCLQTVLLRGRVDHIDGAMALSSTVTPWCSMDPAAHCSLPARPGAPPAARPAPRPTGPTPISSSRGPGRRRGRPGHGRRRPCLFITLTRALLRHLPRPAEDERHRSCLAAVARGRTCRTGASCPARNGTGWRRSRSVSRSARTATTTAGVCSTPCAPELWRRLTRPCAAPALRVPGSTSRAPAQLHVSFAKVAEYQRRGSSSFTRSSPRRP